MYWMSTHFLDEMKIDDEVNDSQFLEKAECKEEPTEVSRLLPNTSDDTKLKSEKNEGSEKAALQNLLKNRSFLLYISSYLITIAGEWLTYVATLEVIEHLLGDEKESSRKYVSILVVFRLMPFFLLIPFGGIISDGFDRRKSMITLDIIGSLLPPLYLLAIRWKCITIVYLVTLFQSSIAAIYEPCRTSILPLMVNDDEEMRISTTITGLAWSGMTSLGSAAGGYLVGKFGMSSCFFTDSATFVVSAFFMFMVGGTWDVSERKYKNKSLWDQVEDMTTKGFRYIASSTFWPLIFLKITTSLVYGAGDILNVAFAEEDPQSTEEEQSERLGQLFFMVGLGCILGPLILEPFTNMKNPKTVLDACVLAFALQAVGCISMSYFKPFKYALLSTVIRAMGSSLSWIDSQVLLQMVCDSDYLGRVVAVDFGLALTSEAFSAMAAGILQDNFDFTPREVSALMGILAIVFFFLWLYYRIFKCQKVFDEIEESKHGIKLEDEEQVTIA